MSRRAFAWAFVFCTALLSGCIRVPDALLYNHTGITLTVTVIERDTRVLPPGSHCEFRYRQDLVLRGDRTEWRYELPQLPNTGGPKEYVEGRGFIDRLVRLQVDPEGTIQMLPVGATMPQSDVHHQPPEFPARPLGR
jgi:hypothetical protein